MTVRSGGARGAVRELLAEVERVAEIPRAIREGPPVEIRAMIEGSGGNPG